MFLCKFAVTVERAMEMTKVLTGLYEKRLLCSQYIQSENNAIAAYEKVLAAMTPNDDTYLQMSMLLEKSKNRLIKYHLIFDSHEVDISHLHKALTLDVQFIKANCHVWMQECTKFTNQALPFNLNDMMNHIRFLVN